MHSFFQSFLILIAAQGQKTGAFHQKSKAQFDAVGAGIQVSSHGHRHTFRQIHTTARNSDGCRGTKQYG
ncbi:MAG: hypothetical protein MUP16_09375, partial [Sedimentisphaerales bacterium]|nr:hypothetical protein [Sedimentisphaerales bacterium]